MELREAIYTRRSVRKYEETPIPHEVLEEILQGACMAPSGVNLQPWYFVVLESPETVETYRSYMIEGTEKIRPNLESRFAKHPQVVKETTSFLATAGGAPVIVLVFKHKAELNEEPSFGPQTQGIGAAIQNLLLLAWEKGIGSCWMTAPVEAGLSGVLEEAFAPGKGTFMGAIALGYPAQTPKVPLRKTDRYTFA